MSARVPKCQKIKNGWLDQYGTEPFEQQQFGTAGVEGLINKFDIDRKEIRLLNYAANICSVNWASTAPY